MLQRQRPDGESSTWYHVLAIFLSSPETKACILFRRVCLAMKYPSFSVSDRPCYLVVVMVRVPVLYLLWIKCTDGLRLLLTGITLPASVERRLDKGIIAIIPIPEAITAPTLRTCLLPATPKAKETVWAGPYTPGGLERTIIRLEDIDKKELAFLSDNRPPRRYLYFWFIISYLQAMAKGNTVVSEKVTERISGAL
ncbi:hypothetical protein BDW68DRAFT_165996 [Aspergillus falconensis]